MTEIVYVTNVRLPTHRAHGLQIMKMCEAFAAHGLLVRLIVPRLRPSPPGDPFAYYGVKRNFRLYRVPVLEVVPYENIFGRWLGYVQNFSFTFCGVAYAFGRGWLGGGRIFYTRDYTTAFWASVLGLRPVLELHDYRSHRPLWRIGLIVKRARLIVANSEGTLAALRAHYPVNERKTIAIPNAVDAEFFNTPESPEQARAMFGISPNANVIAYIGQLETVGLEKGVSLLLEAFRNVWATEPHAHLVIAGGPQELVQRYREQARLLGIPEHTATFTGQIAYRSIPVLLRAIDIAVIPFPNTKQLATTASPIKVFEFMAAGKTILASNLPSLRRYLNDQNAAFFEPSDAADLTKQIRYLIDHSEHARSLGDVARSDAARYTWKSRAQKIIDALHV